MVVYFLTAVLFIVQNQQYQLVTFFGLNQINEIFMKVIKFGGSSVANAVNIKRCIDIIKNIEEPVIVVVSALSGVTDLHS